MKKEVIHVDLFDHYKATMPHETTLEEVAATIRQDRRLQLLTDSYRALHDKAVKTGAPLFGVACRFREGRPLKHVTAMTGLTLVDLDHLAPHTVEPLREKACADPHTLMCYVTISGTGLRILCHYALQPEKYTLEQQRIFYTKAFHTVNDYYGRLLGATPDAQCKNPTRLSGLAHDPRCHFNPEAQPFGADELDEWGGQHLEQEKATRRMRRETARIQRLFDATLAPELEAEGAVYREGAHNDFLMRLGYKLNQYGFSLEAALQWATPRYGEYEGLTQIFTSCYRRTEEHGTRQCTTGGSAGKVATVDRIRAFLTERIRLRYNEITARVEYAYRSGDRETGKAAFRNLSDRVLNSLWSELSQRGVKVFATDIARVIDSDFTPVYHPFRHYMEQLPAWREGDPDYLRELARTVTVEGGEEEQERFFCYLRKWMAGMVAAWTREEVVNNVILVFIGPQGGFKTSWFQALLPPELRSYFHLKVDARKMDRDELLKLAQYGLVCCEELDAMQPAEVNRLKAAVTMGHIDERAAYARYHEHRRHIASFCGTGNNPQFLSDPTGNRRWLPFAVRSILPPREHPFPYTGIFAQVKALLDGGFRYWFTQEEIATLNRHNARFEVPRLEKELVLLYFRHPTETEHGLFMPTARILQHISANISQKLSAVHVGRALAELGFKRVQVKSVRGYLVVPRTGDEMVAYQKSLALHTNHENADAVECSNF